MHPNDTLITEFYAAFQQHDAETMAASYADTATFQDPAFGKLDATEARNMWRMLLGRATDLRAEFTEVHADDAVGTAHWEAWYTFTGGHKVHNVVEAEFTFVDGLIATHVDTFDWPRWAGQALGLPGKLLGRTSFLHNKAKSTARAQLEAFTKKSATT